MSLPLSIPPDVELHVITGGPCAGKSTGLVTISEKLRNLGYPVLIVPEVATELFTNGVEIGDSGIPNEAFQEEVLLKQLEQEARYARILGRYSRHGKKILLCDRGGMDGRAYMNPPELFEIMVKRLLGNDGIVQLRDQNYKTIYHLITAAIGAEEFYTTVNNRARKETLKEAVNLDIKTREAWSGHSHLRIFDNSTDFEGKMQRLWKSVCQQIGIPTPLEIERKYLLRMPDMNLFARNLETPPVCISIVQTYLKENTLGTTRRIRKRGQDGSHIYYYSEKQHVRPGIRIETERTIPYAEYEELLQTEADTVCDTMTKNRFCFIWNSQYFELDIFTEPKRHSDLVLLEVELTEENDVIDIPPFLFVVADVTNDDRFTNHTLSRK